MKRGKLFLTAFAVVALVGSALAFNAAKFGTVQLYFPNPNNPSICDQPSSQLYKAGSTQITATTVSGNPCTTLFSTTQE